MIQILVSMEGFCYALAMNYKKHEQMSQEREGKDIGNPDVQKEMLFAQDPELLKAVGDFASQIYACPPDPEHADIQPRALLVGGFVRDSLMGNRPKDADVEVLGLSPARLESLLDQLFPNKVDRVGQQFGILKIKVSDAVEFDVSIPRRESKSGLGHKGFTTASDPAMSIKDAAKRRDFSWNALSADVLTGEVFDHYGGIEDLKNKTLRVTDPERFQDDPLRVLRAIQFAARLDMHVEPASFALMKDMVASGALEELPPERMTAELEKLLLKSERPSIGFELARRLGVIAKHFPELHALIDTPQEPEWHPEGDVWTHTMMVVDSAARIIQQDNRGFDKKQQLEVMLSSLCHDLGKPATTEVIDGKIRSLAHEEAGAEPTKQLVARLSFGEEILDAAIAVARDHLKPGQHYREFMEKKSIDEKTYANIIRRLIKRIHPTSWQVLVACSESDFRGRTLPGVDTGVYKPGETMAKIIEKYKLDTIAQENLIRGKDIFALAEQLGIPVTAGPKFGQYIKQIEALRDSQKISTKQEALEELARYLKENAK